MSIFKDTFTVYQHFTYYRQCSLHNHGPFVTDTCSSSWWSMTTTAIERDVSVVFV